MFDFQCFLKNHTQVSQWVRYWGLKQYWMSGCFFAIMCFCPSIVVVSNLCEQCIYFWFLPRFTNQCNSKLYFANSLQFEPHICFNDNFWWEIVLYLDCSTFVMPRNACQLLPPLCPPQACAKRNMMALPRTYQSFLSSIISTLPHNLNNAEQVEVQIN